MKKTIALIMAGVIAFSTPMMVVHAESNGDWDLEAELTMDAINSKTYYDIDNDLYIPKGGEFVYEQYIYRIVKQRTKNHRPEVEIVGLKPEYDKENNQKYLGENDIEEEHGYVLVGIGDNAFKDNKDIRGFFTYSDDFRYIGKSAFEGCTSLRYFGNNGRKGISSIKDRAFYGCTSFKNIDLSHDRLKYVGKDAFRNTKKKLTVDANNMSGKYAPKVRKMLKKAGAKKVTIKLHYYKEYKGDPCH